MIILKKRDKMIYITTFFGILFKYWWIFPAFAIFLYGYFFIKSFHVRKIKKEAIKIENPNVEILSEEEKFLNISLTQKEINDFKPRMESLIKKLIESKDIFSVTAIEAIFIAEKVADSLKLNEDGILVIEYKVAKKLSIEILKNPMEIIHYIKAVEKKIDTNNENNKIPLNEVLYMMRNAKRFGLYKEKNSEDEEIMIKLRVAIHDSYYSNVPIKLVEEMKDEVFQKDEEEFYIVNTHKFGDEERTETTMDPDTKLMHDSNIEKVEQLGDGKIKIFTKNRKEIIRSDFKFYEFRDLVEEEEEEMLKKQLASGELTSLDDITAEFKNILKEVIKTTMIFVLISILKAPFSLKCSF